MRIAHGLGRGNAAERRRGVFLNPGLKSGVSRLDSFSVAAVCAITIGIGPRFSVGCVALAACRGLYGVGVGHDPMGCVPWEREIRIPQ